jgi:hypothetical protein
VAATCVFGTVKASYTNIAGGVEKQRDVDFAMPHEASVTLRDLLKVNSLWWK